MANRVVLCQLSNGESNDARQATTIAAVAAAMLLCWPIVFYAGGSPAADVRKAMSSEQQTAVDRSAEIARLIHELGANTFMARQHAQRLLIEIGLPAKPALDAAVADLDPEVRQRARQALAAIGDVDFHARVRAFLADSDGNHDHGLLGWQRFRSLAGDAPAARRLFADMQRAERELLQAVASAPREAGPLFEARCLQADGGSASGGSASGERAKRSHLSLATMSAMLFAASDPQVPVSDRAGSALYSFRMQTPLAEAAHAPPSSPVRALLGAWVAREFESGSITAYYNQALAMQYGLKEAVAPALKLIEPPGGPSHWEHIAILTIAKLGSRDNIAALEPLLNDERSIEDRSGQKSDTQIRDVALAAMVHLSGQKVADYGFHHAQANPASVWNANSLGFDDPAARQEALKKWRAWTEKQ